MNRGVLLLVVGVLVLLVSLLADTFGFGTGGGMGWKQITGAIVGLVIALFGVVTLSKGGSSSSSV